MDKAVIHCRKCGRKMEKKRADFDHIALVANLIRACLRLRDRVRDVPLEPPPDGR